MPGLRSVHTGRCVPRARFGGVNWVCHRVWWTVHELRLAFAASAALVHRHHSPLWFGKALGLVVLGRPGVRFYANKAIVGALPASLTLKVLYAHYCNWRGEYVLLMEDVALRGATLVSAALDARRPMRCVCVCPSVPRVCLGCAVWVVRVVRCVSVVCRVSVDVCGCRLPGVCCRGVVSVPSMPLALDSVAVLRAMFQRAADLHAPFRCCKALLGPEMAWLKQIQLYVRLWVWTLCGVRLCGASKFVHVCGGGGGGGWTQPKALAHEHWPLTVVPQGS
jgi:hypothetical protein